MKNLICVACPMGCALSVELSDSGEVLSVTGNTCKRGIDYAKTECTNPVRSFTSTIKVSGGILPVVPCKSAGNIPKEKLLDCAAEIAKITAEAPVKLGDILIKNILGTGVDIIATNHCPEA